MNFRTGDLYHVFNQGNNRQKIFFTRDNYLFFLTKIKLHILPHADILAWCLMPNHFHLMIYVHTLEVTVGNLSIGGATSSRTPNSMHKDLNKEIGISLTSSHPNTHQMTPSHQMSSLRKQDIRQSIAIMLRSYTRAINLQENRTGSLFKPHTHAECLTTPQGITPSFFNTAFGAQINVRIPEKEYPQACFNYIHQNPAKAKLVVQPEDWEFSSYPDYCGARNGKLINRERATELGLTL